jgi:hypothetical protein
MREYPWLARQPHWEHQVRFGVVRRLAALAPAWLAALELPASLLNRKGVSPELESSQDALKRLDSVPGPLPAELLGARTPDEFLDLLGRAARVRNGLVLDQILKKDSSSWDRLKGVSFELGRQSGYAASAELGVAGGPGQVAPQDPSVRTAFLALGQRSFSGLFSPGDSGMLLERLTDREASWVDLDCPHRDPIPEVGAVADRLCDLLCEWRSGFCAGWDARLKLARLPDEARNGRCRFTLGLMAREAPAT